MNIRCIFPAVLDTLAYSCSRKIFKHSIASRLLSSSAPLLCSDGSDIGKSDSTPSTVFNAKFVNRNPRTLEITGLARKRKGWRLQYPSVNFYHRVILDMSARNTTAKVVHTSGKVVVSASTKEQAISKHLFSNSDVSAVENIGRVLAQRCLESGIMCADVHPSLENSQSEKVNRFRDALEAGGLDLTEPEEVEPKYRPGLDYDNPELMEDLKQRQEKVEALSPFHQQMLNLRKRRNNHYRKHKGPMVI